MAIQRHVAGMSLCAHAVSHADLWLDDISIDMSYPDVGVAATQSVEAFKILKWLLQSEGLTINMRKT